MQVAIIKFPGSPSSSELALALQRAQMEAFDFSWDEKAEKLFSAAAYLVQSGPGASSGLSTQPAFQQLLTTLKTQSALGKPLLALGYAVSFLLESGLVPGLYDDQVGVKLASHCSENKQTEEKQEVKIRLSEDYQYNAFSRYLSPQHILTLRLSHLPQRFILPTGLLMEIEAQGLNVFSFCNAQGEITKEESSIAAISNKAGNVMAMLPHPEYNFDGDAIFRSMHDHIASGFVERVAPLYYWPRK